MPRIRIIGLGQEAAGDDGVGPAVIAALGSAPLPDGVALATARDAGALIDLLQGCEHAVVVDAAVGAGPPGSVQLLEPGDLQRSASPLSSHGLGVGEAIQLSRVLSTSAARRVSIVTVGIDTPTGPGRGLSPAVSDAIDRARQVVLDLAGLHPRSVATEERA